MFMHAIVICSSGTFSLTGQRGETKVNKFVTDPWQAEQPVSAVEQANIFKLKPSIVGFSPPPLCLSFSFSRAHDNEAEGENDNEPKSVCVSLS